ncbi:MAG: alpha/beta hydrolase [Saprospiraceae bacterium]|nr:alpha/beta hydrolase [Saprospiraceae bacterium]
MKNLVVKLTIFIYSNFINGLSVFNKKQAANAAMRVFQKPRGKKITSSNKAYLLKYKAGDLLVGSESIAYYNWPKTGKKILLLHGWESYSYRWRPYIKDLQKLNYNVFALDAPAHGLSSGKKFSPTAYADAIKSMVEKEKIELIIAHSVGAYAAIIYASENTTPRYLEDLILLAPTGKLQDFMNQFFDFLKLNDKVREGFRENFIRTYGHDLDYFDSDNLIKKVTCRGLLIHDKEDKTLPFKDSEDIAANWPIGKFIATKGFGHRLKGPFIKELILNYLKKVNKSAVSI